MAARIRGKPVEKIRGIDGDNVQRRLLIDPQYLVAADLTKPIVLDFNYDLTLCIEVAEHLSPANAAGLVDS
jgi:hypothetical protein